jgi:hypothetical protein
MAKTLIWLQDNHIDSYDDLKPRSVVEGNEFHERNKRL